MRDREGLLALVRELPAPRTLKDLSDLLADRVSRGLGVARAALLPVEEDVLVARDVDGGPPLPALGASRGGPRPDDAPLAAGFRGTPDGRRLAPQARGIPHARARSPSPGGSSRSSRSATAAGACPLSAEDTELLETVLAPAALALDHARLYDELRGAGRSVPDAEGVPRGRRRGLRRGDRRDGRRGRITSVNPAFETLFGTRRGVPRRPPRRGVLPQALRRQRAPPRLEADLGSGPRVLNVAVSPFPGAAPGSRARVLVLYDATETARLERALADRERLAALGTLSAGVAHEVNTPLAGVAGFARLLLDETPGDDPRRPLVEKIERQAFRASRLVGSLLDLARGRPREIVPLDPADLAGRAAGPSRTRSRRGARPSTSSRPVAAGRLRARDALVQVLVNLLKNGARRGHVPREARRRRPRSRLRVAAADGNVLFTVEDNGPGLTDAEAAQRLRAVLLDEDGAGRNGAGARDREGYHPRARRLAHGDFRAGAGRPVHGSAARRDLKQ